MDLIFGIVSTDDHVPAVSRLLDRVSHAELSEEDLLPEEIPCRISLGQIRALASVGLYPARDDEPTVYGLTYPIAFTPIRGGDVPVPYKRTGRVELCQEHRLTTVPGYNIPTVQRLLDASSLDGMRQQACPLYQRLAAKGVVDADLFAC